MARDLEKQNFVLGSYTLIPIDTSINVVLFLKSHVTLNYSLAAE